MLAGGATLMVVMIEDYILRASLKLQHQFYLRAIIHILVNLVIRITERVIQNDLSYIGSVLLYVLLAPEAKFIVASRRSPVSSTSSGYFGCVINCANQLSSNSSSSRV